MGNFSPKIFKIQHSEYAESGDETAWNSRRRDFIKLFCKDVMDAIWIYQLDGESVNEMRTRVYATDLPNDKIKYIKHFEDREIELIAPDGVWTYTTPVSDSEAILGATEQTKDIVNDGLINACPIFSYTPTGNQTSFQVKLTEGFMFRLDGSFANAKTVSYNMRNGELVIDSAVVDASNYLTLGSPFALPASSTSTVYITCSGAGLFEYTFYSRDI